MNIHTLALSVPDECYNRNS